MKVIDLLPFLKRKQGSSGSKTRIFVNNDSKEIEMSDYSKQGQGIFIEGNICTYEIFLFPDLVRIYVLNPSKFEREFTTFVQERQLEVTDKRGKVLQDPHWGKKDEIFIQASPDKFVEGVKIKLIKKSRTENPKVLAEDNFLLVWAR